MTPVEKSINQRHIFWSAMITSCKRLGRIPMNACPAFRSTLNDAMPLMNSTGARNSAQPWSKCCRIPSSFDPANARYKALYRALAQRRIPLLSHVGYEWSLIGKDQSVGHPDRLRVALDEGVTVIAAHACSSGLMFHETFHATLLTLAGTYQRFYADISALTLPNRLKMLLLLRDHPEVHSRLLFGTDYPLSVFHLPVWGRIERSAWCDIVNTNNRFDKQFKICRSLGIHFRSFGQIFRD